MAQEQTQTTVTKLVLGTMLMSVPQGTFFIGGQGGKARAHGAKLTYCIIFFVLLLNWISYNFKAKRTSSGYRAATCKEIVLRERRYTFNFTINSSLTTMINSDSASSENLDSQPSQTEQRNPTKRQYGTRIRQARERASLSQEYLAQCLGVSQNTIWKIENDRATFTVDMLENLSQTLKTEPETFLDGNYTRFRIKQTSHDQSNGVIINQGDFEQERKLWRELDQARQDALSAKEALIQSLQNQLNQLTKF